MDKNIIIKECSDWELLTPKQEGLCNLKAVDAALVNSGRARSYDYRYVFAYIDAPGYVEKDIVAYAVVELYRSPEPSNIGNVIAMEMTPYGTNYEGEILEALKTRCDAILWGRKAEREMQIFFAKTK